MKRLRSLFPLLLAAPALTNTLPFMMELWFDDSVPPKGIATRLST